jgi:hypothetical protein
MEMTFEITDEQWNETDNSLQIELPNALKAVMKAFNPKNGYNATGRWIITYRGERPTECKGEWIVPPFISTELGMVSGGENVGYQIISATNPNCPTGKDSYEDFACDVIDTLYKSIAYDTGNVN